MSAPTWLSSKDLGIIEEGIYFEIQLEASSALSLLYTVISGNLPSGIQLSPDGLLQGIPSLNNNNQGEKNYSVSFTVRVEDTEGSIADRTFSFDVSAVQAPTIQTTTTNLGSYYDGTYIRYQLLAEDNYPNNLTWKLVRGRLPLGLTLSEQGLIEGFLYQNKVDATAFQKIGWDKLGWDQFIWDFITAQSDNDYSFTVELSDGINYSRQNYLIRVIAKDLLTADRTQQFPDLTVTADTTPTHLPFIVTPPQYLPEIKPDLARQDTYFSFKFDGLDLDDDLFYYEITSPDQKGFDQDGDVINHSYGTGFDNDEFDSSDYPMPRYLGLNNESGWYTGQIAEQVTHRQEFTFQVYARKRSNFEDSGYKSTFRLTVLGQTDENITWITDSDLGVIENGSISSLRVQAINDSGNELIYYLKSAETSRTPQGTVLLSNGMISGRVSFAYFKTDSENTKFDNGDTTFDLVFQFTVVAQTANRSAYSEKTFRVKVNPVNKRPYENLYLRAFPTKPQRLLFKSIMDNQEIFPDSDIYRLDDPWYGKSREMRFLFMPGVNPSELSQYMNALDQNHYTKIVRFGEIKTAIALDNNYNTLYEVVYLEIIDDGEGVDPVTGLIQSPNQSIDISWHKETYLENPAFTKVYPNGLGNMRVRIEDYVGLAATNTLPLWMTSPQPDSDAPRQYVLPIGYIRAVVLAHCMPGTSEKIAFRLKQENFNFNRIPFVTDRYELDAYLSNYYDLSSDSFIAGEECTFDKISSVASRFRIVPSVTYAVEAPYVKIHKQTVDYINHWGSIDGITNFQDGETLIFAKQENFADDPYDVYYGFDGTSIYYVPEFKSVRFLTPRPPYQQEREFDSSLQGFDFNISGFKRWVNNDGMKLSASKWLYWSNGWLDSLPFNSDRYEQNPFGFAKRIPGYIDKILSLSKNTRAAVYRINIDANQVVTLTPIRDTEPGDVLLVEKGVKYQDKQMYFEAYPNHGNVPRWWIFDKTFYVDPTSNDYLVGQYKETTFDNRGTRFFTNRDQYTEPQLYAKYIKFPKFGVFV